MKINVSRDSLLKTFAAVGSVANQRSNKPVLACVKAVAERGRLTLMATDLEISIRTELDGVDIEEEGAILLPVAKTLSILRECPEETLTIGEDGNALVIHGKHSDFKLMTESPAEFPTIEGFEEDEYHEISSRTLSTIIERTYWCADPDSQRFALGGIMLDLGDECNAVATDGRRLARQGFQARQVNGHAPNAATVLLPQQAALAIQRILPANDSLCRVYCLGNDFVIAAGASVVRSRMVEGRFPKWRQVIPNTEGGQWHSVELPVGPLAAIIRQASIVADSETRGLDLTFGDGVLKAAAQTADLGKSLIDLPIGLSVEDPIRIRLDYRFVLDFLKTFDADATVQVNIATSQQPVLFVADEYRYVVMPMALKD